MWFLFALLTTLAWGTADLFYKKGSERKDTYTHIKIVIMVGLVMGIHGLCYMTINNIDFNLFEIVRYFPVSALYILSMTLGYIGLRYIELSISSPIQNSSGAVTALLCLIFLKQVPSMLEGIGVLIITIGLIWMAIVEKRHADKLRIENNEIIDKKYTTGFLAIIFPILYCIIDGLGTFADAIYLNEENPIISEDSALLAYEFTFLICGILAFIYLRFVKKEKFILKEQKNRFFAAIFETMGQVAYVFVIGANAVVAAPMIASYCIISVILSRIFLKEKLNKWQYIIIIMVMLGIAVLGLSEGLAGEY
jgi:drug/metabolite transporter (DMT)-like permease